MTRPEQMFGGWSEEEPPASRRKWLRRPHAAVERENLPELLSAPERPSDVARTEKVTFICTQDRENAARQQLDGS